jgi:hypothetical protein
MPSEVIGRTIGFTLQSAMGTPQPLVFDGAKIMNERWPWSPDTGYATEPQPSATWYDAYAAFKRGEFLPLPHFDPRPTDPEKQARLTEAYSRYRAGEIAAEALPDLADIFPDDPQVRAEIGLQTEPLATPAEALIQGCGMCHNDVLDQTLSRARFNIDLSKLGRGELDAAIARLKMAPETREAMPPAGRRQLDATTRDQLIDYLGRDTRPSDDNALLQRAAHLGMAMPQPRESSGLVP